MTFPLTLLLDPVSSSDQEVDVVIDLICASSSDMVSFEKTVQAFIDADRHDLFSLSPGSSRSAATPLAIFRRDASTIRYTWRTAALQPEGFLVLVNMFEFAHRNFGGVKFLSIQSTRKESEGHVGRLAVDELSFPIVSRRSPFPCALRKIAAPNTEILLRLKFKSAVPDSLVPILGSEFRAWDALVVRGGYFNDLDEMDNIPNIEEALAGQQTYLTSPTIVEHVLYESIGSVGACHGLVNLAQRIDRLLLPVANLEIE